MIISSHVTPPLRSLMARILPPALSWTQEILSTVCMCTNERDGKTGPVCREPPEKLRLTGLHMALLPWGVSFVSGGFAPLERQKCCWNWIAQTAAVWGAKKRKLKNSSYIISFMQLFISSCIHLIVRSRQHTVIQKENIHIHTSSLNLKTL